MNDNNGCLPAALVLALCVIIGGVLIGGAPNVAALGLSWDSSAAIARSDARVEMNREDNITKREQSENNRIVAERWATVVGVVGVVLALAWAAQRGIVAWAARPHRPAEVPAMIMMLAAPELAAEPRAWVEWSEEDGSWVIVNPRTETVKLLEDRQAPPRRG